jgi:fructoselysine and glucoselysine-specific PTS system IID component
MTEGGNGATGLTRGERFGMFLRSFLLQSVWNVRGMQNVGFCFSMLPLLGRFDERPGRTDFLRRHLAFFNTNPVFAGYVLGAVGQLEARGASESEVQSAKSGLASPLGMAGDSLIWGALRPFAGVAAVIMALGGVTWAPFAVVAVYGVPAVALRARGLAAGAALGTGAAKEALGRRFRTAVLSLRAATAFGLGIVLAASVRGAEGLENWRVVVATAFLALAWLGARARVPSLVMGIGGAVVGLLLVVSGLNGG